MTVRVLVVLPGVSPDGGAERSFVAMAPGLQELGVRLHVAVLTERQGLVADLERRGVVIHDLSATRGVRARARRLVAVMKAIDPDLVHASLHEANVPAQIAARVRGVPVLVTWANTDYGAVRHAEPGAPIAKLGAVRLLDAVLGHWARTWYHAVTVGVAELNATALRIPRSRVMIGRRGRDPEAFTFCEHSAGLNDASRERPGTEAAQVVLAIGRQDKQKGYPILLRQFDQLAQHRPGVRLQIVGRSGSATPEVRRALASMEHADRVDFLGQRDDVAELLRAADVMVCSSWREGAAGAIIEAMASGTPVVSVPLAGAADMLADGHNSVVVPHESLAQGLDLVLADPGFARRIAGEARRTFEEGFTIARATERMVEIYEHVVSSAGTRADQPR